MSLKVTQDGDAYRFEVWAKPRAKKSGIGDVREDGSLEVALAAPPADGAANEELLRVLGEALNVPDRNVVIVRGASSRKKLVAVTGPTSLTDLFVRLALGD
jgi:uncharacterized protein (TIGR00251 family)